MLHFVFIDEMFLRESTVVCETFNTVGPIVNERPLSFLSAPAAHISNYVLQLVVLTFRNPS